MNIDQHTYRRLCLVATWAFIVAAIALWVPWSWQTDPTQQGKYILHLTFGVLEPLRATWQSSADGFWLGFSGVRLVALLLSAVLTVAAVMAARETYRRGHTPVEGLTR